MSWFNIGERVEAADGRTGKVVGIAFQGSDEVLKVDYDNGQRTAWLWASQFREEQDS